MIRIVTVEKAGARRYCPWLFCDFCGLRIADARRGNYLFHTEPVAGSGELFHVHKGCSRQFEMDRGGLWLWGELSKLPLHLAANIGVKVRVRNRVLVMPDQDAPSALPVTKRRACG
jgi:hypothetical protein